MTTKEQIGMEYIRKTYNVPARLGVRVCFHPPGINPSEGTITGIRGAHLLIKMDGENHARTYHPTWELDYHDH